MRAQPSISVVIPTHNRVQSLMRSVRGFEHQSVDMDVLELIIVADGCRDSTVSTIQTHDGPIDLRVVELDGRGPGAARNAGAESARGPILLFVDDDVEPAPHLVEAHLRAHEVRPDRVVMGPYPPSLRGRSSFFRMRTRTWWQSIFHEMARPGHRFRYSDLLSGNLSLSAERFRQLGGFDPSLRVHEDFELGARIMKAGIELHFEPRAHALHHEHETMTLDGLFRRARNEGRADVAIGRLHPQLRSELFSTLADSRSVPTRQLRHLAFRWPRLGGVLAHVARACMPVLEGLRMRHRWGKVLGILYAYWHLRGVADVLGSTSALAGYVDRCPVLIDVGSDDLVLELDEGMEAAERRLDATRPAGVRLRYGLYDIGRIEPALLAERLKSSHLRPILAERFSWPLLKARARLNPAFDDVGRARTSLR